MVLFGNQQNMKPVDTITMFVSSICNLWATCV